MRGRQRPGHAAGEPERIYDHRADQHAMGTGNESVMDMLVSGVAAFSDDGDSKGSRRINAGEATACRAA